MNSCRENNHNCLKELYNDHEKILESMDNLETAIKEIEIDLNKIRQFLDFTRDFSEPHHQKEEKVLFPKLKEKGIPEENGPIGMMLFEHDIKRGYVEELEEAMREKNEEEIIKKSREIISLMRDHIYKEDNVLYPCAKDVLSEEEMLEMGERCSQIMP